MKILENVKSYGSDCEKNIECSFNDGLMCILAFCQ